MKTKKEKVILSVAVLLMLLALPVRGQMVTTSNPIKDTYDFRALIFAGQDRYHYLVIPDAIKGLERMAQRYQFKVDWTLAKDVFGSEELFSYDVVVFLSADGGILTAEERENFQKFINQGGGFVGIHAVGRGDWEWFDKLIGREFMLHSPVEYAVMDVIDKNHPATMHLPDRIVWTEEWFSYGETLTEGQHALITVDESSYEPEGVGRWAGLPTMGDFHAISWYQEYDGGRSFYTGLGHGRELYQVEDFLIHIYGGMLWAATGIGVKSGK